MRLLQLQILSMLKKEHSLVNVAKKLFISQPSISTALKELEQELGCSLLERTNRGMKFTSTGKEILQQARIILDECENIRKECQKSTENTIPKIRLGLEPDATKELYAQLLVLAEKNKKIDLESSFDSRDNLIAKLCDDKLDACIMSIAQKEYEPSLWKLITEHALSFDILARQEICFISSENHPLQEKASLFLEDILQYSFALTERRDKYFMDLFEDTAKNKYVTYIHDPESYFTFLKHTDTVGICACHKTAQYNARYGNNLKPLFVQDFTFCYLTICCYHEIKTNNPLIKLLKTLKKIAR